LLFPSPHYFEVSPNLVDRGGGKKGERRKEKGVGRI